MYKINTLDILLYINADIYGCPDERVHTDIHAEWRESNVNTVMEKKEFSLRRPIACNIDVCVLFTFQAKH